MKILRTCASGLLGLQAVLFGSALACGTVGPTTRSAHQRQAKAELPPRCEASSVLECESVCVNGDWGACELAGLGYLKGTDVTQDLERAELLLHRSCDQARPKACAGYAKMSLDGQGPKLRPEQVASYLEVGCKVGDLDACVRRGNQLKDPKSKSPDLLTATSLWTKACDGGELNGCFQLGINAKTGRAGTPRNTTLAAELLIRSCESSIAEACFEAAQLELTPGDAASNAAHGSLHLEQACELKHPQACSRVAFNHQHGRGVPFDLVKARELHRQACKAGVTDSCVGLAELLEEEPKAQLKLYSRACEAGNATACFEQARRIEAGSNLTPEQVEAVESGYRKACDQSNRVACGRLGLRFSAHASLKQRVEAVPLLEQGCTSGEMPETCLKLGQWYAAGEPIPRDGKRASALLGPLCQSDVSSGRRTPTSSTPRVAGVGPAEACYPLARVVLFGYQIAENPVGAANLFATGCSAGHGPACLALAEQQWLGLGGIKKQPDQAVQVFHEQCEQKVGRACADLGYALQQGVGITRDLEAARKLFESECAADNQLGCAHLGNLLTASKNAERERGQKLLVSACDAANGKACWFLAENAPRKGGERLKLLERACTLEVLEACSVLKHERR